MNKYIILFYTLFIPFFSVSQKKLYPKRLDNLKYGYVDNTATAIITAKFDKAFPFDGNYAKIIINGKWGLIDKNGDFKVKPRFDYIGWSNDPYYKLNSAHLSLSSNALPGTDFFITGNYGSFYGFLLNGKWGLINSNFKTTRGEWDSLSYGQGGNYPVYLSDKEWTWIDNRNKAPKDKYFNQVKALSNGLIAVQNEISDKYELRNSEGENISESKYNDFDNLNNLYIKATKNGKYGVLDQSGKTIYEFDYDQIVYDKWNHALQFLPYSPILLYDLNDFDTINYEIKYKLDSNLLVIKEEGVHYLWNKDENLKIKYLSNDSLEAFDDLILKMKDDSDEFEVLDRNLNKKIDFTTDSLIHTNFGECYFIKDTRRNFWLIFDLEKDRLILNGISHFSPIKEYKYSISIKGQYGIFDISNDDWYFSCNYDQIEYLNDSTIISRIEDSISFWNPKKIKFDSIIGNEFRIINDSIIAYRNKDYWKLYPQHPTSISGKLYAFEKVEGENIRLYMNDKWGLFNLRHKKWILKCRYDEISEISLGHRIVKKENEIGIINESGDFTLALNDFYEDISPFKTEWTNARHNGLAALVDKNGILKISSQYEAIGKESQGLYPFKFRSKWGVLNKKEKLVIQPLYDSVKILSDKYIAVCRDGKCGMKNLENEFIIEMDYNAVRMNDFGNFLVNLEGEIGLFNSRGSQLRPVIFEEIHQFTESLIALRKSDYWQLIDEQGNFIDDKKYSYLFFDPHFKNLHLKEKKSWIIKSLD